MVCFDLAPILGRDADSQWTRYSLLYELVEHPILPMQNLLLKVGIWVDILLVLCLVAGQNGMVHIEIQLDVL